MIAIPNLYKRRCGRRRDERSVWAGCVSPDSGEYRAARDQTLNQVRQHKYNSLRSIRMGLVFGIYCNV